MSRQAHMENARSFANREDYLHGVTEHRGRSVQLGWYCCTVRRESEWGCTDVRSLFAGSQCPSVVATRCDLNYLVTWQQHWGNVLLIPTQQPRSVTLSAVVSYVKTGYLKHSLGNIQKPFQHEGIAQPRIECEWNCVAIAHRTEYR